MYDTENRRFMAKDTNHGYLETPQTLNPYPYVLNNPKTYTDPTGELIDELIDKAKSGLKKVGNVAKAVLDFSIGTVSSIAVDMLYEPIKLASAVTDSVVYAITGKSIDTTNTIESDLEDFVIENIITNEEAYYAGRMVGDAISFSAGIVITTQGLLKMGNGLLKVLGYSTLGAALTPESGGGSDVVAIVLDMTAVGEIAGGAVVTGYGGVVSISSYNNFGKNYDRFQAASEGPGSDGVNEILNGAKPGRGTKGKTTQYVKPGSYDQALREFESLNPSNVKDITTAYGSGKTGTLPDGRTITVRPGSSAGPPTLEIRNPKNNRGIEIRYGE